MAEKLSFSFLQLIEEKTNEVSRFNEITPNTFEDLETKFHIFYEDCFYEILVDRTLDYIWINIDYGNPMPKDENLTNIITGDKLPNKREDDEVELTSQLFILYHYKNKVLYISNIRKMKFINDVLSQKLNKKFLVKKYFKTREEFIQSIKTITEITFTDVANLFNDNQERNALIDLTGTGAPEKFKITATYPKNIAGKLIDFINEKFQKVGTNYSSLIIKGTDESDFDFVYNQESFVKKIEISCNRNNLGKFMADEVKKELLNKI